MKQIKLNWRYYLPVIGMYLILTYSCSKDDDPSGPETVTDIDGNVYHTVTICSKVWLVENLKVTKFRNGNEIPYYIHNDWDDVPNGEVAYCNYGDTELNGEIYGHLYNWSAVNDSRNLAPQGWHIPSDAEWGILVDCLGGEFVAGGKLKENGFNHWQVPNEGATNESGFTALPGNYRIFSLEPENEIGFGGFWWTSTSSTYCSDPETAVYRSVGYDNTGVYRDCANKVLGLSVRCLKD